MSRLISASVVNSAGVLVIKWVYMQSGIRYWYGICNTKATPVVGNKT